MSETRFWFCEVCHAGNEEFYPLPMNAECYRCGHDQPTYFNEGEAPCMRRSPAMRADVRNMVEPAGMLAQDATESQRMTYAGRRDVALRQAKIFDESRIEKSPLFENAKRQGGLF